MVSSQTEPKWTGGPLVFFDNQIERKLRPKESIKQKNLVYLMASKEPNHKTDVNNVYGLFLSTHTPTWSRSINNFSFSSSPSKAVKWVKKQQNNPVEWPAIFSQSWWSFHYNIHSSSSLLIGHFHSYIIVFDCQFRYCFAG